jgi:hypothetical protein
VFGSLLVRVGLAWEINGQVFEDRNSPLTLWALAATVLTSQRLVARLKTDPHATVVYAMQVAGEHPEQ